MTRRMRVLAVSLIIVLNLALFANTTFAAAPPPIKALIVTGQSNHNWRLSTPIVMQILEQTGLFDVDIAISPDEGGNGYNMEHFRPDFAAYDVVVFNYVGDDWSEWTRQAFVEYVSSGGIYKRKNPDNDTMLLSKNSNYRRLRVNGGFDLPLDTFSLLTIRFERLSKGSLMVSITLNGITYTTIDDDPTDQPAKIDVFAITFPNARNYTRWVLAVP